MISQILPRAIGAKEMTLVTVDGSITRLDAETIRSSLAPLTDIGPEFFEIALSRKMHWRSVLRMIASACKRHDARFEILRAEAGSIGMTIEAVIQARHNVWLTMILIDSDWLLFAMPPAD